MIEFWQPATVIFQFADFEITPTVEEISQIADLPLVGKAPLAPRTTSGIDSLQFLGLRVGPCLRRADEGSNLLLPIWAVEYFYQRKAENGSEADLHNKIRSHAMILSTWDALNNEEGCRLFLTHLTGNRIQWRLTWVYGRALLRVNQAYFIELIGLQGFQPYAPLRVLRQFGITQGVPQWSNMALIEVDYEGRISIERIAALEFLLDLAMRKSWGSQTLKHQIKLARIDDEPNEEMEEDLGEDPREPTEEIEGDSEGYLEHNPNFFFAFFSFSSFIHTRKITDKDEFNVAANIMIPIKNLEVRELAKLSATTFPTFKTPINFTKVDLPSADLPNQPEQTQHVPAHGRVKPGSPTAVRTIPNLSNRDPTVPTMQQILGEHIAAPYESHVPPVYAVGAPTFTTLVVVNIPHWRTEAARVQPPLDESELSKYLFELKKMGDFIEEGVKCGKIQSIVALQATSRAIQSGSIGSIERKMEDVSDVTY
ncbi:hypothetical protein KY284_012722 [Solanum tuberosum]|nr:hypothetical protein KY284_012722 [Solanum tuberosum]